VGWLRFLVFRPLNEKLKDISLCELCGSAVNKKEVNTRCRNMRTEDLYQQRLARILKAVALGMDWRLAVGSVSVVARHVESVCMALKPRRCLPILLPSDSAVRLPYSGECQIRKCAGHGRRRRRLMP
jgi:hypothetical protein